MKTLKILAVIGALLVLANSQSKATNPYSLSLNKYSKPNPDLAGGFVNVDYTYDSIAGSGNFTAQGWTQSYYDASGSEFDVATSPDNFNYTLSAIITGTGVLTSGTLTISGDLGSGEVPLLSGDLKTGPAGPATMAFGYGDGGNQIFQFIFAVTGGDPAIESAYGGIGTEGWVDLYAGFDSSLGDIPFTGSWTTSFNSINYNGNMDTLDGFMPVPEPTTAGCFLLGLGALACCQHFSKNRRSR